MEEHQARNFKKSILYLKFLKDYIALEKCLKID